MTEKLEAMRLDYDWVGAFGYAGQPDTQAPGQGGPQVRSMDEANETAFGLAEVEHIEHSAEGENDENDWVTVGKLTDGRWFYLSAWCDYTGWD